MSLQELIQYLRQGGVTMVIIIVASILSLGVALERLIALWNVAEGARVLAQAIHRHLLRGDLGAARAAAQRSDAFVADLFRAAFDRLNRPTAAIEGAVERERVQLSLRLRRNLWILGTLGATTPFIGLFGTVAGIMRSFKDLGLDVQGGGTGGTAAVMTGISEALVATAAGILVAVESVVFFNYFQTRVGRLAVELRLMAEEFLELLRERHFFGGVESSASSAAPLTPAPAAGSVPAPMGPAEPGVLAGDKR